MNIINCTLVYCDALIRTTSQTLISIIMLAHNTKGLKSQLFHIWSVQKPEIGDISANINTGHYCLLYLDYHTLIYPRSDVII